MTTKKKTAKRLTYRIDEAAEMLGIGRVQTYEAARRGDIPVIRMGRRLLVPKVAFDRLLAGPGATKHA